MEQTLDLLQKATNLEPLPYWTKKLELSKNTLSTSKIRGHLSPAIAGRLAEFLEEDVERWVMIAALESERDSACKTHLLKRMKNRLKRSFYRAKQRANNWTVRSHKTMIWTVSGVYNTSNGPLVDVVFPVQISLRKRASTPI